MNHYNYEQNTCYVYHDRLMIMYKGCYEYHYNYFAIDEWLH